MGARKLDELRTQGEAAELGYSIAYSPRVFASMASSRLQDVHGGRREGRGTADHLASDVDLGEPEPPDSAA